MRRLERKYGGELVVVGIHSPKFTAERHAEAVRQAILRLNVGHPVASDRDHRVWEMYAVRAWPTLMFIDPRGQVIGKHEGEFDADALDRVLAEMIREFDARGLLDHRPLEFRQERPDLATPLMFPGKVLIAGGRLFIADSGHHRIVVADPDGTIRQAIGSGEAGLVDGLRPAFHQPQGMALDRDILYVADTENHAIRAVDLATGEARTVAGTGRQLTSRNAGGPARETDLSSPWDLARVDGTFYVAMAGVHQIWALRDAEVARFAGNGREALVDGSLTQASFNQPSGLATDGAVLYVADSEASAIRVVDPRAGAVRTIVGEGLLEFGDRDGAGPTQVRLQHPLGITWHDGAVYVADTYNHKVKRLDPATAEVRTVAGTGEAGYRDGLGDEARFSEPSGLAAADGKLYVADTNNGVVRIVNLETGAVATLTLRGL